MIRVTDGTDELATGEIKDKMPGVIAGMLGTRLADIAKWTQGTDVPKMKRKVTTSKVEAQKDTTIVAKISAEKEYCPARWQAMLAQPGDSARKWAANIFSREMQYMLGDTFVWFGNDPDKWQHTEQWGLWRMETVVLKTLIECSGKRCSSGYRYFVEPYRWETSDLGPAKPSCDYKTVRREKDEEKASWADRVFEKCGALGMSRGSGSVGIRTVRDSGDSGERVRTWKLERVPAPQFGHAQVQAICEEQGLKEITFKAQKRAWKWQSDKYDVKTWIIEAVTRRTSHPSSPSK